MRLDLLDVTIVKRARPTCIRGFLATVYLLDRHIPREVDEGLEELVLLVLCRVVVEVMTCYNPP